MKRPRYDSLGREIWLGVDPPALTLPTRHRGPLARSYDQYKKRHEPPPATPPTTTHPYTFLGKTSNDEDVFERGLDALGLAFRVRTFRSRPDAVAYASTNRTTGADELWLYDEDTDAWVREGDTLRARVSEAAYPEEHIRAPGEERDENPAVGNVHLGRRFTLNERRALRAGHLNPQIEEAIARARAGASRPRARQSAFGEVEEDRPAPASHRFAANCAVHRQLTAADFERRPNPESNRGRSGLGLGRHDAREARGGRFVSTPPCDACGKPTGADYMTDSEVCGDSDGPGFFICNRSRCSAKCEKLGVEERRALYTATRASSRRDNPADDVPLTS